MKRTLSGLAAAFVVLAAGSVVSACRVTPTAATANGDSIAVSTLNSRLSALNGTAAGQCLLQLEYPQLAASSVEGAGSGTWLTSFASTILSGQVESLLAIQYGASKGITVGAADLAAAQSEYESTLNGAISADVQQSTAAGAASACQGPDGTALTGRALLDALPAGVRTADVRSQAVDDKLLARGADLSNSAVLAYYLANRPQFAVDCVSQIITGTQAQAEQIMSQLGSGADFASLARSNSIDTQTAATGGQLGCRFTAAQVEQDLQVTAITVGSPLTPVQTSGGQWAVYEVTSQTAEPVTAVASVIRSELLHSTPNVQRIDTELAAFARRSEIAVNPQYGTWRGLTVVTPPTPAPRYLLPGASASLATAAGTAASGGSGSAGG